MATSVTPQPGLVSQVATGGVAVTVVPAGPNGGFILNPYTAADQGLSMAETLTVDPVNAPDAGPGSGWGTATALQPGQSWQIIPGQSTVTKVNAESDGHRFTVVWY